MNTYKVTLANKGGHERRETVSAMSNADAERKAESMHLGYGAVSTRLLSDN